MTNRLSTLVDSYQLATKQPPPSGQILVHNQIRSAPEAFEETRGFRAWWAMPGKEFAPCACGWRPDLGEHFRVQRAGPIIRRR
jgi:hypothetical protein